jgi:hypothetical protein
MKHGGNLWIKLMTTRSKTATFNRMVPRATLTWKHDWNQKFFLEAGLFRRICGGRRPPDLTPPDCEERQKEKCMSTNHALYGNWKQIFDVKVLRSVRTSCRSRFQTCNVAFGSAWTVLADISRTFCNMGMFLMKQGIYSYMYVLNVMHGLWDIRILWSLVPKESPCI